MAKGSDEEENEESDDELIELTAEGRPAGTYVGQMCFENRAFEGVLKVQGLDQGEALVDAVRLDCLKLNELQQEKEGDDEEDELDGTFWIPATARSTGDNDVVFDNKQNGEQIHCLLEWLALQIFDRHTYGINFDPERSGCEWWTQCRPIGASEADNVAQHDANDIDNSEQGQNSEGAKRRKVSVCNNESHEKAQKELDSPAPNEGESIQLHFDKDETLCSLMSLCVHPALSTVTYLTDEGAPTIILPYQYSNHDGETQVASGPDKDKALTNKNLCTARDVVLSYPAQGNHLCFDGRLLHGAPAEFRVARNANSLDKSSAQEGHVEMRVSFLVNIWLNHHPESISELPLAVARKLRKVPCCNVKDDLNPPMGSKLKWNHPIPMESVEITGGHHVSLWAKGLDGKVCIHVPTRPPTELSETSHRLVKYTAKP